MRVTLPVYLNDPFPLQTLIDLTRSVRQGCFLAQLQDRVLLRSRLSEAQNHRCCWCAHPLASEPDLPHSPTIEHVVPLSQGGASHPDNYAVACRRCNEKRATKPVDVFLAHISALGWRHPRAA